MVEGPYRLLVLEGAGHWLQFERADEVSAAIVEHVQGAAEQGQ
jgi:pimeloyl-ACP methyl ester carboxylesterase